ncbi:DUF6708 domain-containing protein [Ralstonia sp. ASV6]|uniref:DUF6708 domain-containing protein n=1 Tax=Ralstonia sp. ASV6 TaxID=2795124 RepID=UPI0018EE0FC5|nr:DUF6708 domain-containing protein [Ralstonia sp. ASV6]
MAETRSKLQPQSPYWYEDLPSPTAALDAGKKGDQPDPGLDVRYIDAAVCELSRVTSIQRGFGLMFGIGISIGFVAMLPFLAEIYADGKPQESPFMASFLMVVLLVLVVLLIHMIKRAIRTPLDLPVLFDRNSQKIFALEYLAKPNPFVKWKTVIKEFDWSCVQAEVGKISGYNGKTYSVRYGLILAQCEQGTTKVEDRIILKQDVGGPLVLHKMWAYIRCYMNEGPERLRAIKPFPRDVNFRRCVLEFYPLFDRTAEGKRIRASMHIIEQVLLTVFCVPLFWLFLPAGVFEYIGQRLAPKPKWPAEVISQIAALRAQATNGA